MGAKAKWIIEQMLRYCLTQIGQIVQRSINLFPGILGTYPAELPAGEIPISKLRASFRTCLGRS